MKITISITSGTLAGKQFELEKGFLSIGRNANCSIRFDPVVERLVSKQHAFIEEKPDGFYITDNNSSNGTFVNGERIESVLLKTGDVIQFGKNGSTASVEIETAGSAPPATPDAFRNEQIQQFNKTATYEPENLSVSVSNIGLGQIKVQPEKDNTGLYLGIGATILAVVFLVLVVIAIMFLQLGPVAAVIASVVAFVPCVLYIIPFIMLDRYDPEPFWLLALAFAWGALVAVIVSIVLNTVFGLAVGMTVSPTAGQIAGAVISAPIVEEASKGIGLLILLIFFRKYFDDILDGIVFGGVIALGFATVENVLYYGRALVFSGFAGMALTFFMRGILSPFAHVTFTMLTGIGCGIARESHNKAVKIIMPILGYFGAVFLHMLWNGMATFGNFGGFLLGYLIIEIPLFLIFIGFAGYIMYRQNRILKEMLAIDVARGLIPEEHVKKATSVFGSTFWRLGGLGGGKFRARTQYLRAIGNLGLSYWHIQRATAAQGQTASFQQNPILREEVLKWREQVD